MSEGEIYIYAIAALLPLTAIMLVLQVDPYNALIVRGILGAIAALLYAVLGAPDVALTEALVGTMLAITLYAVAVRSSMVVRLGVSAGEEDNETREGLLEELRGIVNKRQMRLELISYGEEEDLHTALHDKEIHATCIAEKTQDGKPVYRLIIRLQRLYDMMQSELKYPSTNITYLCNLNSKEQEVKK
ncbi:MAG: DUF4040 domain-containing protein [Cyanobacteria bacterium SBLK]|nr:DUF4040 domain-containing protein [Cyanobacteria bacterium SBLK]